MILITVFLGHCKTSCWESSIGIIMSKEVFFTVTWIDHLSKSLYFFITTLNLKSLL